MQSFTDALMDKKQCLRSHLPHCHPSCACLPSCAAAQARRRVKALPWEGLERLSCATEPTMPAARLLEPCAPGLHNQPHSSLVQFKPQTSLLEAALWSQQGCWAGSPKESQPLCLNYFPWQKSTWATQQKTYRLQCVLASQSASCLDAIKYVSVLAWHQAKDRGALGTCTEQQGNWIQVWVSSRKTGLCS